MQFKSENTVFRIQRKQCDELFYEAKMTQVKGKLGVCAEEVEQHDEGPEDGR
jgi:hypothetical protein